MKTKKWLTLTVSLTLACFCVSAGAQSTNDPTPVPDTAKPKPAAKPAKKSKKDSAKAAKKEDTKKQDAQSLTPLTPGPAIVKEKNVNVRGQAAINSEVVAHLKRGDHIQVLEEVTLKNPKTDEPSKWAKIALPTNAPVWVNATFLDANKSVVPKKLNLRSGPGENYSVIGRIPKGTAVKEIESKGDWIHIEAPGETYAFVAAHLIANDAGAAPVLASTDVPKPVPAAVPAAVPAPIAPAPAPPIETAVVTAKPPVVGAEPAGVTPPPVVDAAPAPVPAPIVTAKPPVESLPPTPTLAPLVKPEPPEEDVKRIVTREGFVKRSVSIQAPTYFVLENLSNGKTINYLFSTNLVLKDFKGKRVLVTGEEMLDERWPNIPVITIDKMESVEDAP